MKKKILFSFLALLMVTGQPYTSGGMEPIVVIVNKANNIQDIKINQLAGIYRGQLENWDDGQRVIAIDRPADSQVRKDFYLTVLGESPTKKFFRLGSPLPVKLMVAQSDKSAVKFVATIPNALAYVYLGEADDSVNVIKIDGQSPQGPNYPLR